jgi:hypothetical protein
VAIFHILTDYFVVPQGGTPRNDVDLSFIAKAKWNGVYPPLAGDLLHYSLK